MENLGKTLKNQREIHGYSQTSLADELHISRQAISKWERNIAVPDIYTLLAICKLYQITIDELILKE